MSDRYIFSSESVGEGHPDKVADTISDAVLDACLAQDRFSRVACETFVKSNVVVIGGEITTKAKLDFEKIARSAIREIGYVNDDDVFHADKVFINLLVTQQSADIAQGVDARKAVGKKTAKQGAGDQGLMFGYASNETPELMPAPVMFAHRLGRELTRIRKSGAVPWLRPDAKSQVSVVYENGKPVAISNVVISTQHAEDVTHKEIESFCIEHVIRKVLPAKMLSDKTQFLINPTGRFVIGGPQGDTGLTGRKIIVDTYGGMGRHGGGAFSGKDPSQGRSQRRLHGPLGGEEHRGRQARRALRDSVRLRHRLPRPGQRAHRHVRHLHRARREDRPCREPRVQFPAGRHHRPAEPAPADLLADHQLRPLRQEGHELGSDGQGQGSAEGDLAIASGPKPDAPRLDVRQGKERLRPGFPGRGRSRVRGRLTVYSGAQATHVVALGSAARRAGAMARPQLAHRP